MIKCGSWPIGVCSWCMGNDLNKLAVLRDKTGLTNLNLGIWKEVEDGDFGLVDRIDKGQWVVDSTATIFPQEDYTTLKTIRATGGIMPDSAWQDNRKRVLGAIEMTRRLGVGYLLFHFGFFDYVDKQNNQKFKDRVRELADAALDKGVSLLMETGQERAEDLCKVLTELRHPALKVNLDPGNMILYNKNKPVEALTVLAPWIRQIHAKDAIRATEPEQWGKETPWGDGQVDTQQFLKELKKIGYQGSLIIEREVGEDPVKDIELAISRIRKSAN